MKQWQFYTTKEIKPDGWLKRQLKIQANGLSGNLHKVWHDIRDSSWIGGDAEGWERVPLLRLRVSSDERVELCSLIGGARD